MSKNKRLNDTHSVKDSILSPSSHLLRNKIIAASTDVSINITDIGIIILKSQILTSDLLFCS